MTRNQLVFGLAISAAVVTIACVWSNTQKEIELKKAEVEAQINAQTEIERIKIEEEQATVRTKERMKWNPWYLDSDSNEEKEEK